jgi:virulence factor Mce-like protein
MRRRHNQGLSYTTVGIIALVVTVVICYLGFTKAIPFEHHFQIKAVFKTSNNLAKGSFVRIAGVNVGKVVAVQHSGNGDNTVTATLRINDDGLPIHKDATAKIRPRIFLEGNFFVDLTAGSPSAPVLGDGDVIPVNQTSAPVQFDQVLGALQADSRSDLRLLLKEYGQSLAGGGAAGFNRSLKYWKGAYRDGAIVSDATLGQADHDLSEYERGAATVAAALDRSPQQLQALITDFNRTAAAFASKQADLQAAVGELPRTLRVGYPALGALDASFPNLRRLAQTLRPGVRSSGPALDASKPLLDQLRGLVSPPELEGLTADLRRSIPSLAALTRATVPLYQQVRLASSCQNEVILPWSQDTVPDPVFKSPGPVYQEAVKPLTGLAGESRSGDANGQWFRVLAAGGTNLITLKPGVYATNPLPINGSNPPASTPPPLDENTPCETQQKPNLASKAGPPPPQRRIDTSDPKYVAAETHAKDVAVAWLKKDLRREGLDKAFSVGDQFVTPQLVSKLAAVQTARQAAQRKAILERHP